MVFSNFPQLIFIQTTILSETDIVTKTKKRLKQSVLFKLSESRKVDLLYIYFDDT